MNKNLLSIINKYNEHGCFIAHNGNIYWFNGKRWEFWCFYSHNVDSIMNIKHKSDLVIKSYYGYSLCFRNKLWMFQNGLESGGYSRFRFGNIIILVDFKISYFDKFWQDITDKFDMHNRNCYFQMDNYLYCFTNHYTKITYIKYCPQTKIIIYLSLPAKNFKYATQFHDKIYAIFGDDLWVLQTDVWKWQQNLFKKYN